MCNKDLDNLEDVVLPAIEADIDNKYTLIEKADSIYEDLSQEIDDKIAKTKGEIADVDEILGLLEESLKNETDESVKKELRDAIKKTKKLKNKLDNKLSDLEKDKVDLDAYIKKLDSLD